MTSDENACWLTEYDINSTFNHNQRRFGAHVHQNQVCMRKTHCSILASVDLCFVKRFQLLGHIVLFTRIAVAHFMLCSLVRTATGHREPSRISQVTCLNHVQLQLSQPLEGECGKAVLMTSPCTQGDGGDTNHLGVCMQRLSQSLCHWEKPLSDSTRELDRRRRAYAQCMVCHM